MLFQSLLKTPTTVLFDLDGTLLDTAHDLGLALNIQLARHHKDELPHDLIWPVASHGSQGLLALGFGITPKDSEYLEMRAEYLEIYSSVFTRNPKFLPDIESLLTKLDLQGITWGIVTNKPRRFSLDLIKAVPYQQATLYAHAACLVCGDDAPLPKPSPATLLMACQALKVQPENCVYVGDAARDVEAGRAAKMKTVVALFGYIAADDVPLSWAADAMIKAPEELLTFLGY